MKALAHPVRHRIWRELGPDGATVSQLSHRLATNKGNVAHHVKVLVAGGLVVPGQRRTVRGGTEQYYLRTAEDVRFGGGDEGVATRALLDSVADDLVAAPGTALLNHRTVRLTRPQAEALGRHLDRLVTELEPAGPGERPYGVLVGLYPRSGAVR